MHYSKFQAKNLLVTLNTTALTGTIEAVGVLLTLPEGVTVVDVKPSEAFTEGYLSQYTDIVRLELNIPETNSAITLEMEAMNPVGWEGDLIVDETMNHILHLPLIQR